MTPDYIHDAPREALDALHKYHEEIYKRGIGLVVDWKYYPDIYAFIEWGMDFSELEEQLQKLEGKA